MDKNKTKPNNSIKFILLMTTIVFVAFFLISISFVAIQFQNNLYFEKLYSHKCSELENKLYNFNDDKKTVIEVMILKDCNISKNKEE